MAENHDRAIIHPHVVVGRGSETQLQMGENYLFFQSLAIFHPLEVVSRYRDPKLQVGANYPISRAEPVDGS